MRAPAATVLCVGEPCAADETPRVAIKRDLCNRCYLRWWKSTPPEMRSVVPSRRSLAERIQSNLTQGGPDDCHEWRRARDENGYGLISVNGRSRRASRVALICALGRDEPGLDACHTCDNPPCCNPRHLYFGTRKQNSEDAWARGRHPVGSQRPAAKLIEAQVIDLRERYSAGGDAQELAAHFGIQVVTLRHIVTGRKWKQVGGPITYRRPKRKAA